MDTMNPEPQTVSKDALPANLRKRLEGIDPATSSPAPDPWVESAEDRQERVSRQALNRSSRWRERLPRNYAQASLSDLDPAYLPTIQAWIKDKEALTLILAGNVGAGKTYAAYAIGNYAVEKGSWVECWSVHAYLEAIRPDGDPAAKGRATKAALLILDDLGSGRISDFAKDEILALMDARVNARLRTVVTTNVSDVVLEQLWDKRTIDRLKEGHVALAFTGESRRKAAW